VVAVMAFGWVEDLAGRRRPALWPSAVRRRDVPARSDVPPLAVLVAAGVGEAAAGDADVKSA
jgi:hypothetical protein